jgi:hypothetical protein
MGNRRSFEGAPKSGEPRFRRLARVETHRQIVGGQDRRITANFALPYTARDCFHQRIRIRVIEKGDRIPLPRAPIDDAMRRRNIDVVGPTHQTIADVDDEGAGDDRRFDPLSGARADLEPPDIVGRE